jgi:hypothetical protein
MPQVESEKSEQRSLVGKAAVKINLIYFPDIALVALQVIDEWGCDSEKSGLPHRRGEQWIKHRRLREQKRIICAQLSVNIATARRPGITIILAISLQLIPHSGSSRRQHRVSTSCHVFLARKSTLLEKGFIMCAFSWPRPRAMRVESHTTLFFFICCEYCHWLSESTKEILVFASLARRTRDRPHDLLFAPIKQVAYYSKPLRRWNSRSLHLCTHFLMLRRRPFLERGCHSKNMSQGTYHLQHVPSPHKCRRISFSPHGVSSVISVR